MEQNVRTVAVRYTPTSVYNPSCQQSVTLQDSPNYSSNSPDDGLTLGTGMTVGQANTDIGSGSGTEVLTGVSADTAVHTTSRYMQVTNVVGDGVVANTAKLFASPDVLVSYSDPLDLTTIYDPILCCPSVNVPEASASLTFATDSRDFTGYCSFSQGAFQQGIQATCNNPACSWLMTGEALQHLDFFPMGDQLSSSDGATNGFQVAFACPQAVRLFLQDNQGTSGQVGRDMSVQCPPNGVALNKVNFGADSGSGIFGSQMVAAALNIIYGDVSLKKLGNLYVCGYTDPIFGTSLNGLTVRQIYFNILMPIWDGQVNNPSTATIAQAEKIAEAFDLVFDDPTQCAGGSNPTALGWLAAFLYFDSC
jgi:hypothetical protein